MAKVAAEKERGVKAIAYGNNHSFTSLGAMEIERRVPGARDVAIEILYSGVCHSDLHQASNDWSNTVYPCVPGHEIVGRVTAVGADVTRFREGETVAVGTLVDSCRECARCEDGLEQYCEGPRGATQTYNGPFKPDGTNTFGGYSDKIVVDEHFVFAIPEGLDVKRVAPLLCAGLTTYSPLKHWQVGPGTKVGIIGLGGLGHMAVKSAVALGADVTVFSTSAEKEDDARRFGATGFVLWEDDDAMSKLELSFDFLLDTIPYEHDINPFVKLLKFEATIVVVGLLLPFAAPTNNQEVVMHRRNLSASVVGGVPETVEFLEFCAKNDVQPDVEMIAMDEINDAHKRMKDGDVRFRYVIDVAGTMPREA